MEFARVGISSFVYMGMGFIMFLSVPVLIGLIWMTRKKEPVTTILAGAATFLLFVFLLEKPIQNALVFPTLMGLPEHAASRYINARPVLWGVVLALFPGVFEETGRLVAYQTVLRKRKNKETSISHGIGHGLCEVMALVGLSYISMIIYAIMINSGSFGKVVEEVAAQAPDQVEAVYAVAGQIATFSFDMLAINAFERFFAVLFHIGASIIVFYACKDKKKIWLYPLAIILHTVMDVSTGLNMAEVISLTNWQLEAYIAVVGSLVFIGAYFLLYRRDKNGEQISE